MVRVMDNHFEADGEPVLTYCLRYESGIELTVTNLGAAVVALRLPDGKPGADILLGYENLRQQLEPGPMFGATLGRYAGKICRGVCEIGGTSIQLSRSHGEDHAHGGIRGFDKRVFTLVRAEENAVTFRYTSLDGEEGYPGTMITDVTYALLDEHTLELRWEAVCDRATVAGLSNHMYFNLGFDPAGDVSDHLLQIDAPWVAALEEDGRPAGRLISVEGDALDLRTARRIGIQLERGHQQMARSGGWDLDYVFARTPGCVRLTCPETGRSLQMETAEACVHLYVADFGTMRYPGKNGALYMGRCGVCLEPMYISDCVHSGLGPSPILLPSVTRRSSTRYTFAWETKEREGIT